MEQKHQSTQNYSLELESFNQAFFSSSIHAQLTGGFETLWLTQEALSALVEKIERNAKILLATKGFEFSNNPSKIKEFLQHIQQVQEVISSNSLTFAAQIDLSKFSEIKRTNKAIATLSSHLGEIAARYVDEDAPISASCKLQDFARAVEENKALFLKLYEISQQKEKETPPTETKKTAKAAAGQGFGTEVQKQKKKELKAPKATAQEEKKHKQIIRSFEHYQSEFRSRIERISDSHFTTEVFRDWAEISSLRVAQLPYNSGVIPRDELFHQREDQYFKAAGIPKPHEQEEWANKKRRWRYNREELTRMADLLSLTYECLLAHERDFLGSLYMEYIGKAYNGEFFTPEALARLMARVSVDDDTVQMAKEQKLITIDEPAAGAGGLIIAFATELGYALGVEDVSDRFFFQATDVSRTCFNLSYIQLSLLGFVGRVNHSNTLSLQMYESRPTPALKIMQHDWETNPVWKMYRIIKDPDGFLGKKVGQGEKGIDAADEQTRESPKPPTQEEGKQEDVLDVEALPPVLQQEMQFTPNAGIKDFTQLDLF